MAKRPRKPRKESATEPPTTAIQWDDVVLYCRIAIQTQEGNDRAFLKNNKQLIRSGAFVVGTRETPEQLDPRRCVRILDQRLYEPARQARHRGDVPELSPPLPADVPDAPAARAVLDEFERWVDRVKRPGRRPRTGTTGGPVRTKGKHIDERMRKVLDDNSESVWWTQRGWAARLECSTGTIDGSTTWTTIMTIRAQVKAERMSKSRAARSDTSD